LLERTLAHAVLTLVVVGLSFAGIVAGTQLVELEFNLLRQFEVMISLYPALMVIVVFTALLGVVLRRRSVVLGAAAVFVLTSYFLDTLGAAISEGIMPALRQLSFLAYNSTADVIAQGIQWADAALLMLIVSGMLALALVFW
jgi:hypothetical protein